MTGFLAQSAQITQFGVVAVGHLFDQGAEQIGAYAGDAASCAPNGV
jgi:hypothetical protein